MALNEVLKKTIENQLFQSVGKEIIIKDIERVQGGDISETYRLLTNHVPLFLKVGQAHPYPDFFEKELSGLKLLAGANSISVPKPFFSGRSDDTIFLVTEFIQKEPVNNDFWDIFAEQLANLHRQTATQFGLPSDNYIGSLPQSNRAHDTWASFYCSERIEPLVKQCIDNKLLDKAILTSCEVLYKRMEEIFPPEQPALIHGDLWGGNYLAGPKGQPYIFDPAAYYGIREMDLAMSRLFGGFDRQFYWHYDEFYPLPEGWQQRITLCQLYPLLVHALLFGGGYIQRVKNILSSY